MSIIKIAITGIVAVILITTIKKDIPAFAVLLSTATGILLLSILIPQLATIIDVIKDIFNVIDTQDKYLKILFKIIAISYIGNFSAQICTDMGQAAIGNKIELGAKIITGVYTLPIIKSLMEIIIALLP